MSLMIGVKNLFKNLKSTIYSVLVMAFGIMLPVLLISLILSFLSEGVVELESISYVLRFYISDTHNAFNKLAVCSCILLMILGMIIVTVYAYRMTTQNNKSTKSYLLMGASYGQVMAISWVASMLVMIVGIVVGGALSYMLGLLFCKIFGVRFILDVDIFMVASLISIALVSIISLIVPLWVNTSLLKTKK